MANDKDFVVNGPVVVGKDTKVTVGSITSSDIDLSTGNYFDDTLSANTTYTISNAGDVQAFQLEVTGGTAGYAVENASYDSVNFSVASQETNPSGMSFNNDGTKMYVVGRSTDSVYQYSLSTAYDITTASYDSVTLSVSSQDGDPYDIKFNNDGTSMYIVGRANTSVFQYTLSTAFDLSTASYASKSFNFSSQDSFPTDVAFNSDGTKMIAIGYGNDNAYQYSLSTAFDVSTASYDSVTFGLEGDFQENIVFSPDGTKMFITTYSNARVYYYTLSTAFDISTATQDGFYSVAEEFPSRGIAFNGDGTKMFIITSGTNDYIYQYSTVSAATLTWPSSIEWTGGSAPSAPANGETDVYTFTTDDGGTTYTGIQSIDNAS